MKIADTCHAVKPETDACPPPSLSDSDPPSGDPSPLLDTIETTVGKVVTFQGRKREAVAISKRFKRLGLENKGRKIGQCSDLIVRRAFSCGHSSIVRNAGRSLAFRCKDKFCPVCNHARSVKLSHQLGNALHAYVHGHGLHAYHLVLTFRNTDGLPDYTVIRKQVKRLFNSDAKARRIFWDRYGYHGALVNFETTVGKDGKYHPHFHVLLITERPIELIETGDHAGEFQNGVNQQISDMWLKITGDSYIVKGKSFEFSHMFEMVKYMTKGISDIPDQQLVELVRWSQGKRFLSLIGKLYANEELRCLIASDAETHDEETCPECGCNEYVDIPMLYDHREREYRDETVFYGCNMEAHSFPP